jgi:serine/threonine-protein kinase
VWAFSVLLYESITGRRPFDGPNYNALIAAILTHPPAPIPDLSPADSALWYIIERGLAKDVSARWPTIRALATALAAWIVDRGIDEDLTGASISRQWLSGKAKRPFAVLPDGEAPDASGAYGAPSQRFDRSSSRLPHSRSSSPIDDDLADNPFRQSPARRVFTALLVLLVLGGAGAAAYFFAFAQPQATTPPPPEATATVAAPSSVAPSTEPSVSSTTTAAPTAPGVMSGKPFPSAKPPRATPVAPKVPKHIDF